MSSVSRLSFIAAIAVRASRPWLSCAVLSLLVLGVGSVVSHAGPESNSFGAKRGGNASRSNGETRSATIGGQAFVITMSGRVTFAVGARVTLVPVTDSAARSSENRTVTGVAGPTPVAPSTGVVAVTAGGVVSVCPSHAPVV